MCPCGWRISALLKRGPGNRLARLRAITPRIVPRDLPWRNPEDRELFLSGLRLAVGETT